MRALRMLKRVQAAGTIHLDALPLKEGETVEIIVLPVGSNHDEFAGLSASGLEFWDNDIDDQVWNDEVPST